MEKSDDDSLAMTTQKRTIMVEQPLPNASFKVEDDDTYKQTSPHLCLRKGSNSIVLPPVSSLIEQIDSTCSYLTSMNNSNSPPPLSNSQTHPNIFISGAELISSILDSSSLETHQMAPLNSFRPSLNSFSNSTVEENPQFAHQIISFPSEQFKGSISGSYFSSMPTFIPVHTAEIVTPTTLRNTNRQRIKNSFKNVSYPTTPAEKPSTNIFSILEQPNPLQRKSYATENRCLLPNPLIIAVKKGTEAQQKLLSGIVTVKLICGDGKDLPTSKNQILEPVGGGSLTQTLDDNYSTCFSLKVVDTSEGQTFRLLFKVRYKSLIHATVKEYEETIQSGAFVVYSNKHNRTKRKRDLNT